MVITTACPRSLPIFSPHRDDDAAEAGEPASADFAEHSERNYEQDEARAR